MHPYLHLMKVGMTVMREMRQMFELVWPKARLGRLHTNAGLDSFALYGLQ